MMENLVFLSCLFLHFVKTHLVLWVSLFVYVEFWRHLSTVIQQTSDEMDQFFKYDAFSVLFAPLEKIYSILSKFNHHWLF